MPRARAPEGTRRILHPDPRGAPRRTEMAINHEISCLIAISGIGEAERRPSRIVPAYGGESVNSGAESADAGAGGLTTSSCASDSAFPGR